MPFVDYMRLALYHPRHGYYATRVPGHGVGYATAPIISPWFGRLVRPELHRMWEALGQPDPFTVVEVGGGLADIAGAAMEEPGWLNGALRLLGVLADRRSPTFFVLSKADHLTPGELDQVRRFVEQVLSDDLGRKPGLFALSGRAALAARLQGRTAGKDAGEFNAFVEELERFIAEDLVGARLTTARGELARLGASLRDALALEQAARELDAATLAERVERFRGEAARQRRSLEDACTLLDRDVARLAAGGAARRVRPHRPPTLRRAPRGARRHSRSPPADREAAGRDRAGGAHTSFETFRQAGAERTEQAWQELAEAFRTETQQRVDAVREAAADLFAVPLPHSAVPAVSEERERFFYLFVHVGSFSEPLRGVLGRLVPSSAARRRALAWAKATLAREFDKHAGRARWDLTQRLDAVRRQFQTTMRQELDEAIDAIVVAARRAEDLRRTAEADRADQVARTEGPVVPGSSTGRTCRGKRVRNVSPR